MQQLYPLNPELIYGYPTGQLFHNLQQPSMMEALVQATVS